MNKFSIILNKIIFRFRKKFYLLVAPCFDGVRIRTPKETLEPICSIIENKEGGAYIENKEGGAYLRFGDGEINILYGVEAIEQSGSKKLALKMKESFSANGKNVFKSLMIHSEKFGRMKEMSDGFHLVSDDFAKSILSLCYRYFIGENIYSHAALSYAVIYDQELAKRLFKAIRSVDNILFVGNEFIEKDILDNIFGKHIHIKVPSKDAFSSLNLIKENIFKEINNLSGYTVIIFAAGPSSNIIQSEILKINKDVFTFDIGSVIDAISKKNTRAWMEKIKIDENYYNKFFK